MALKRLRGDRSQAEFARSLGITHQATYQRYEAGRIPDGDVLHQMATRLGVSMEELLTGKPPPLLPTNVPIVMGDQILDYSVALPEKTEQLEVEAAETAAGLPGGKRPVKKAIIERLLKQILELKKRYVHEDAHWQEHRRNQK